MSFDDPHSFLFGLNQFATPTANNSPAPSGSINHYTNLDGMSDQQRASALLNGLEAFGSNGENAGDLLEGGSFADQLELWTNANFSFDGPTGHALLGDEDKDKDEGDNKGEDKDEEKRAGKRARNDGNHNNALGGRGKARQRDEEENDPLPVNEGAAINNGGHNDQGPQQGQYPNQSSRGNDEASRSAFENTFNGENGVTSPGRARSQSQHDSRPNGAGLNTAAPFTPFANAPLGGLFKAQQNGFQQGGLPNGQVSHQNAFNNNAQGPQLDLTSLLAIQQLVAHNPLAVASLGSFTGLNPQLGALGAQLNGLGALNGPHLQQLQQQMHHQQNQQAHQQQHLPAGSAPAFASPALQTALPQQPFAYQNGWPVFNNQMNNLPLTGSMGAQVPTPTAGHLMNGNGQQPQSNGMAVAAGAPDDDDDKRNKDKKKRYSSAGKGGFPKENNFSHHDRKMSMSDGNVSSSDSGANTSKMTAKERAQYLEERAAERDQIPPLKLIDTGNPEADAEANRLAIEEDKRKRNTAASARFRVKKKQREAALEARSKDLSHQLAEMRDEITKLRNENQWLKGLIQVRPGGGKDGIIPAPHGVRSGNETLQAAQQLQALQQAVSLQQQKSNIAEPGKPLERQRDTGIRPRGVGTRSEDTAHVHAYKRDRED